MWHCKSLTLRLTLATTIIIYSNFCPKYLDIAINNPSNNHELFTFTKCTWKVVSCYFARKRKHLTNFKVFESFQHICHCRRSEYFVVMYMEFKCHKKSNARFRLKGVCGSSITCMQCVNIELVATRSAQLSFHTINGSIKLCVLSCSISFAWISSLVYCHFFMKVFWMGFINMLSNTWVRGVLFGDILHNINLDQQNLG